MAFVGIDFGTTNSAVAIADERGAVELVPLGGEPYWRSVLYFEPGGALSAGSRAIARYLETEGEGRLVQSIKSHLASAAFSRTSILGRRWQLDDMIAAYLRQLRAASPVDLGRRCVIGRPVRYWGAESAEDDARAVERMTSALAKAGFDEVAFDYEPVGAAARYAARLDRDEVLVVADFGGGTTDFSALRVGPHRAEVLATGGIGVSGDAFDARVIDAAVAPALGRGTRYRDELGGEAPVPAWLYGHLRRWHLLSFLKDDATRRLIARVTAGALDPVRVGRLATVVDDDLGLPLHRAVEGAKVRLSRGQADRVALDAIALDVPVTRAAFDAWIADDLAAIDRVLDDVLARAGLAPGDVDRVFATGGSSLVPAVRARLAARFGGDKLHGAAGRPPGTRHDLAEGEELTSVAWGLAARAWQRYGAG
ncbi:MAG TPA: Hsp70 family protein [Kofleriaceae bacterium]|nr:Hsp70 family protein [Kofleriaceae bacterium]